MRCRRGTLEARLAALISFYRWQEAVYSVPAGGRLMRGAPRRRPARGLLAHLDARSAPGPSSLVRVRRGGRRDRPPLLLPREIQAILDGCAVFDEAAGEWAGNLRDRLLFLFALRGWIRGPSLLIAEKPHGVFSGKKVMAEELFPFAIGGHPVLLGGPQAAAPGQERQVGLDGPTVILKRPYHRPRVHPAAPGPARRHHRAPRRRRRTRLAHRSRPALTRHHQPPKPPATPHPNRRNRTHHLIPPPRAG
jgi:hypothetical protein